MAVPFVRFIIFATGAGLDAAFLSTHFKYLFAISVLTSIGMHPFLFHDSFYFNMARLVWESLTCHLSAQEEFI